MVEALHHKDRVIIVMTIFVIMIIFLKYEGVCGVVDLGTHQQMVLDTHGVNATCMNTTVNGVQ